jgi:hypothetical protein
MIHWSGKLVCNCDVLFDGQGDWSAVTLVLILFLSHLSSKIENSVVGTFGFDSIAGV